MVVPHRTTLAPKTKKVALIPYDWSTSRTLSAYSGCGPSPKVSHTFLAEAPRLRGGENVTAISVFLERAGK
jgi:hypothetical protein